MPLFDYECSECSKNFCYKHSAKKVIKKCEDCGGKLNKLLSLGTTVVQSNNKNNKESEVRFLKKELDKFKEELKEKRKEDV